MARRIAERINDTNAQSWVEGRKLATIKVHWEMQGKEVESLAELVREIVNEYVKICMRNGARAIESLDETREVLRVWGMQRESWLGKGRTEGAAFRHMREEAIRDTYGQIEGREPIEEEPSRITFDFEPRRNKLEEEKIAQRAKDRGEDNISEETRRRVEEFKPDEPIQVNEATKKRMEEAAKRALERGKE
jgi:hypothetical protein